VSGDKNKERQREDYSREGVVGKVVICVYKQRRTIFSIQQHLQSSHSNGQIPTGTRRAAAIKLVMAGEAHIDSM
jgi:hypothetical protein